MKLMLGDCLELMKTIPDGSVDMILSWYSSGLSMREIAKRAGTNHKFISRVLKKNNVETRTPKRLRGKRKFESNIDLKYNNMATHLRWPVTIEWLKQFDDFEKIKFLNRSITNRDNRFSFTGEQYKEFVIKFYNDIQFNKLYAKWLDCKKDKYLKPSVDHIVPRSKGGTNEICNLQFLSWFENRCKNDLSQNEWDNLKTNIKDYLL